MFKNWIFIDFFIDIFKHLKWSSLAKRLKAVDYFYKRFSWMYDWVRNTPLMTTMMNCFCGMIDWWKTFSLISQPEPLSDFLTIANLWYETTRVWTCAEPEFSLSWEKLCAVVITSTPQRLWGALYRMIQQRD